jgi:hypothetical protein
MSALDQPTRFVIGRAPDCDVVLADDSVSRRHGELLVFTDGLLFLIDCHSTQGIRIARDGRGWALHQEVLMSGDRLTFGDLALSVDELLDACRASAGGRAAPASVVPPPEEPRSVSWGAGVRLGRCECGAIKERGRPCPACSR